MSITRMTELEDETDQEESTVSKACTKCEVVKSVHEFYKKSERGDGRSSWCQACVKDRRKTRVTSMVDEFVAKQDNKCANCEGGLEEDAFDFAHTGKKTVKNDRPFSKSHATKQEMEIELKKGRFLCFRCHRVETFTEQQENLSQSYGAKRMREKIAPLKLLVDTEKKIRAKCEECSCTVPQGETPQCGTERACFHFVRVVPDKTRISVSDLVFKRASEETISEEMAKCILLCLPCSRKKHKQRMTAGFEKKNGDSSRSFIKSASARKEERDLYQRIYKEQKERRDEGLQRLRDAGVSFSIKSLTHGDLIVA